MATPTPVFPAAIATEANLKVANNLIQTTLRVGVDGVNTILFVQSTAGFSPHMLVSIGTEIIAIEDVAGAPNPALLVASGGRGFDGTSAAAHSAGARVQVLIDAWHHNALSAEIQAIEEFLGPNGQNLQTGSGLLAISQYNFAAQAPGGSLAAGANVITLAPVPQGVNGANTNHYLYISGGPEAAEAVLITGGTAVAGAASGTVIVTCVRAHTGAWTIQSATGGLQETLNVAGNGRVAFLDQSITLHAAATLVVGAIWGLGMEKVSISRAADYPAGNLLQTQAAGGQAFMDLRDFQMQTPTGLGQSGASIYYDGSGSGGYSNWQNVYIVNGAIGILIFGGSNINLRNVKAINFDATNNPIAALWITTKITAPVPVPFGIVISDSSFGGVGAASRGLLLDAVDGLQASNSSFGGGYGIYFRGLVGGSYIANCFFSNCMMDAPITSAVFFASNGAGGPVQSTIKFTGCHAAGQFNTTGGTTGLGVGLDIGASAGVTHVDNLEFIGCHIEGFADYGAIVTRPGAQQISFEGCRIYDNNLGAHAGRAGIGLASGSTNISIASCKFANTAIGGQMNYAIAAFGTLDKVHITGNTFQGMTIGNLTIAGAMTNSIIVNNLGEDNVFPAVASAAAMAFPSNPNFRITGTTGVTSVVMSQVPPNSSGTLRTVDGAVIFTAGATIGNTLTTTQNVPVLWIWDGTKLYLK